MFSQTCSLTSFRILSRIFPRRIFSIFLLFTLLLSGTSSWSAKVIISDEDLAQRSLGGYVDVLIDDGFSVKQAFENRHYFAPVNIDQKRLMRDFSGALWVRFALHNTRDVDDELWLSGNAAVIDRLKLYSMTSTENHVLASQEMPDALLQHDNFAPLLKNIVLPAQSVSHFYLYVDANQNSDLQLQVLRPDAFFAERLSKVAVYSIGLGLLLMLIIGSAYVAVSRRSQVQLYQCAFMSICLLMLVWSLGIPRNGFPDFDDWYYSVVFALFYFGNILVLLQVRAYVRLEQGGQRAALLLNQTLIVISVYSLCAFLWHDPGSLWLWLPAVVTACFTLNAYVYSFRQSKNPYTLAVVLIRLLGIGVIAVFIYRDDKLFGLTQLVSPALLYYVIAECSVLTALYLANERRKKELLRREALSTASRNARNTAQTELLAEVSHDLRSPVAGILGMADLLQGSILTADQQSHLLAIKNSGQALLNQISAINDRLQLQQHDKHIQKSAFELPLLVEESVFAFRLQAEQRNIEFIVNIHADVPIIVEGDAARLRQILQPLIENAVKYTSQGEVLVDVSRYASSSERLLFSVEDSGRGMAQQQLQELQAIAAKPQWPEGRAIMGLAGVCQLLAQLGAQLQIKSKLGEGSSFSFELDLPALPLDHTMGVADVSHSILRNKRLLIVDDNHSCCHVLKQQAKSWGMLVNTCYDGHEALAMFRAKANLGEDFDALIIDYDMPHLSGLEVADKIHQEAKRLPLMIMLTGLNVMPSENITREAGIQTVLTKPASRKLVKLTLSNLFHMQQRQNSTQPQAGDEKPPRVLIAEDNDVSRRIISKMMALLGVDYKLVADGQLAVDAVHRERFDLILMDCEMPVMNGFDATVAIMDWQQRKQQLRTPVIALTAHVMGEHKQRAIDIGMADFLEKPVKLAELEAVIQRIRQ